MINAYSELYTDVAQETLGCMLEFAVHDLKYNISDFFEMFIGSGLAHKFETGDPTIVAGSSGIELAYDVLWELGIEYQPCEKQFTGELSKEYWVGWALAYYQWYTAMSFEEIVEHISVDDILALYSPYHEMDIRQFVDKMNSLYSIAKPETNLKTHRLRLKLSQSQLATRSGISIRTIQQYEQRQKDINKAQVITVLKLAKALYCNVEDLIEKVISDV